MGKAVDLLIEAFTLFPRNSNRINEIEDELEHLLYNRPMEFHHNFDGYYDFLDINFYVEGIGKLSKDQIGDKGDPHYRLCFHPYDEELEREKSLYLLVESDSNKYISGVAAIVLKYMFSMGKDTTDVALLINDFPDFCSIALGVAANEP